MSKVRNLLNVTALTVGLATQPLTVEAQQVESAKNKTNKNLVEVVTQGNQSLGGDTKNISFEYAKFLQDQQFFEEFLNNKELQELMNKYGEKEVKQAINAIITNENTEKIIGKALKDKNIQKALKEGEKENVEEGVQKIVEDTYNTGDIDAKLFLGILLILITGCSISYGVKANEDQTQSGIQKMRRDSVNS